MEPELVAAWHWLGVGDKQASSPSWEVSLPHTSGRSSEATANHFRRRRPSDIARLQHDDECVEYKHNFIIKICDVTTELNYTIIITVLFYYSVSLDNSPDDPYIEVTCIASRKLYYSAHECVPPRQLAPH